MAAELGGVQIKEFKAKYHQILEFVLSRSNHISVETNSEMFEK